MPVKARSHMTIGMTTGLQTYANYLAVHWLTVYQWSWRHVLTLLNIIIIIIYLMIIIYYLLFIYLFIISLFIIYLLFI